MKHIAYLLLLSICLLTACTSDRITEPLPQGQGRITIVMEAESQLKTRTVLDGSKSLQHASSVYLYVFDAADQCVRVREVPWPSPADVSYHTVSRSYSLTLPAGNYTFLAVGLDDAAGGTYNLPEAIPEGTSLANATVTLAMGKTKDDIVRSELFAGYTEVTVTEGAKTTAVIDLWRRVGGVMGWFTNIPAQIGGTTLSAIQICLYTPQNKSGYLIPRPQGDHFPWGITNPANFNDYMTDPVNDQPDSRILVYLKLPGNLTSSAVLSGGSYILPAAAPPVGDGSEYTLRVEFIGDNNAILKTMRVQMGEGDDLYISPTGSGTGIIDMGGPFRFPIVANRFYGIGSAIKPVDLGGTQDDVVITIDPGWEGQAPGVDLE